MNMIIESKIALYYESPYDDRELVCICEDELVANTYIEELQEKYPYTYHDIDSFQKQSITYIRRAY